MVNIRTERDEEPGHRFNYFNYFTEVEEEFVRRRGKPLFVSPLDWALIESWKDTGVPLHIVLRGINQSFDSYDAHPTRHRRVNSLLYCQQAVESLFAEYRQSQVGATDESDVLKTDEEPKQKRSSRKNKGGFSREQVVEFISSCLIQLEIAAGRAREAGQTETAAALDRGRSRLVDIESEIKAHPQLNAEALERDLESIDRLILETLMQGTPEKELDAIRAEARKELRTYKKNMSAEIYEQTIDNFISRRLREINDVPRLSLFYM